MGSHWTQYRFTTRTRRNGIVHGRPTKDGALTLTNCEASQLLIGFGYELPFPIMAENYGNPENCENFNDEDCPHWNDDTPCRKCTLNPWTGLDPDDVDEHTFRLDKDWARFQISPCDLQHLVEFEY